MHDLEEIPGCVFDADGITILPREPDVRRVNGRLRLALNGKEYEIAKDTDGGIEWVPVAN